MIIPAINVQGIEEFVRRVRLVRQDAKMVQIDVVDGIYATPKNFARPSIAASELHSKQIDVHLMVESPEQAVEEWIPVSPARIAFHPEPSDNPESLIKHIQQKNIAAGVVLSPEKLPSSIEEYIPYVDFLLLLGVKPGRSGQQFDNRTLERVHAIHTMHPDLLIGVDGGVTESLIYPLKKAGASFLVMGSTIFSAPDPRNILQELQRSYTNTKYQYY